MKKITFDPELNPKHRILAFFTFNNKAIVVFLLNLYVKILSFFNLKNKQKSFHIKKINDKHYEVNTEEGVFHTPTVYRTLNLSSGLKWRMELLAKSYGINYFQTVFNKSKPINPETEIACRMPNLIISVLNKIKVTREIKTAHTAVAPYLLINDFQLIVEL